MIVSLLLGLRGFGRDFDITAPPHDTTAQTLAPNDPLLRRLWLQRRHLLKMPAAILRCFGFTFL